MEKSKKGNFLTKKSICDNLRNVRARLKTKLFIGQSKCEISFIFRQSLNTGFYDLHEVMSVM